MQDKVLLSYIILDLLFAGSGALLLVFAISTQNGMKDAPTVLTVAHNLLLMQTPLGGTYSYP